MTDKTVAYLMALHMVAATRHAEWCLCSSKRETEAADEALKAERALEQAIRRAVDWELVAYTHQREIDWARANPGRAGSLYSVPDGPSDIALYARNKP